VMAGTGGAIGTGGMIGTGGRLETGGVIGTGGALGTGGTPGTGGVSGAGGATVPSCTPACKAQEDCVGGKCVAFQLGGMACSSLADCPSWTTCCANQGCDGTRIPAGDGPNSGQFVVSADTLTVTDTVTGLVWQRAGSGARSGCTGTNDVPGDACTWSEAASYCGSLTLGGLTGWRLPTLMELTTIVDYTQSDPSIDLAAFPNTMIRMYWTSSSYPGGDQSTKPIFCVYFDSGRPRAVHRTLGACAVSADYRQSRREEDQP
jgi:hypothetical protein